MTVISDLQGQNVQQKVMALIPEGLKNDKAYINLARATHSTAYMKTHNNNMRKYMRFRKVSKANVLVKERPAVIEDRISDFFAEGCSNIKNGYKRIIFATLKLFYSQNSVNINWAKISRQIGPKENVTNRAYRQDEIAILLQNADPRGKVIVLLLASTGMRIGAVAPLNYGDLQEVHTKEGRKTYAITVYRGEPEEYVTFCSVECAKAIDNYMDYRRRIKENVGQASPLIRNDIDVDTAEDNPDFRIARRIKDGGIRAILEKISKASGLKATLNKRLESKGGTRYEAHLSRAFRKFYYQAMKRAKVDFVDRHALMGHKKGVSTVEMSGLGMIYGTPEESELFEVYQRAMDYLTVDKSEIVERNNQALKRELEEAKVTRKEIEDLKSELFIVLDKHNDHGKDKGISIERAIEYHEWQNKTWTPTELQARDIIAEKRVRELLSEITKEKEEARKIKEQEEA